MKGHSVCQSVGKVLSGKGYNYVGLLGSHETDRQIPNPTLGAVFLICRGQPAVISLIIPSTFLFRSSMPFHIGCFCSAVFIASSRYPTSQPNTSQSPRTHICLSSVLFNMALPDRYPSPHRASFLPPAHPPSSYPERSPRFRGPALADVEAAVRSNAQRLDSQWQDTQSHPPRWVPNDDHYENEYLPGRVSSSTLSPSERPEPSPPLSSNAPFYVPRSPASVMPHPQYQGRPDHRMDFDPAASYEYDYRAQYSRGYQPPLLAEQHLPPSYLQPPMPVYDQQPRWSASGPSDRLPSPERYGQGQPPRERERLAPLRPPPPPQAVGMQRSYSQGRHARAPSSSRRNPYPTNDGRGRVSSSSRYHGGGKRRFEKRSGYGQRNSGY